MLFFPTLSVWLFGVGPRPSVWLASSVVLSEDYHPPIIVRIFSCIFEMDVLRG